jgi:hypothetical protein
LISCAAIFHAFSAGESNFASRLGLPLCDRLAVAASRPLPPRSATAGFFVERNPHSRRLYLHRGLNRALPEI